MKSNALGRWLALRVGRRAGRAVPLVGVAVSAVLIRQTVRRKGLLGGLLDTALNALPLVGALKSGVETVRNRDLIPDRKR
jgi:hypothetical protein